eukprot:scaffold18900_cov101-Isochrysis_galbana.AAC.3
MRLAHHARTRRCHHPLEQQPIRRPIRRRLGASRSTHHLCQPPPHYAEPRLAARCLKLWGAHRKRTPRARPSPSRCHLTLQPLPHRMQAARQRAPRVGACPGHVGWPPVRLEAQKQVHQLTRPQLGGAHPRGQSVDAPRKLLVTKGEVPDRRSARPRGGEDLEDRLELQAAAEGAAAPIAGAHLECRRCVLGRDHLKRTKPHECLVHLPLHAPVPILAHSHSHVPPVRCGVDGHQRREQRLRWRPRRAVGPGSILVPARAGEGGGVAGVFGEALKAADRQCLVVCERLGKHTRDDELRADEEPDLLLHAPVPQHAAADGRVGKVHLEGCGPEVLDGASPRRRHSAHWRPTPEPRAVELEFGRVGHKAGKGDAPAAPLGRVRAAPSPGDPLKVNEQAEPLGPVLRGQAAARPVESRSWEVAEQPAEGEVRQAIGARAAASGRVVAEGERAEEAVCEQATALVGGQLDRARGSTAEQRQG